MKTRAKKSGAAEVVAARPEYDERTVAILGLIRRYFWNLEKLNEWRAKAATLSGGGFARELEWSGGLFDIAAEAFVLESVLRAVWAGEAKGEPVTLDAIAAEATREALRGARSPGRSTSGASNLMDQAKTAAWANLAERGWL